MDETFDDGSIAPTKESKSKKAKIESKSGIKPLNRRQFLQVAGLGAVGIAGSTAAARTVERGARALALATPEKFKDPLANIIREMQGEFPDTDWTADPEKWANAIRSGFSRANLSQTPENLGIALTLIRASSGFREVPPVYGQLPTPPETSFDTLKKQWTGGPMEVNFNYVMELEGISEKEALQKLNSLDEGLYYGASMLKDILQYYKDIPDEKLRLGCIFADWNAGVGRSVRAGLQAAVSKLTWIPMRQTGLLLLEDPKTKSVPVIDAIVKFDKVFNLPPDAVRSDLEKPTPEIRETVTWKQVEKVLGHAIEPTPADIDVPGLVGMAKEAMLKEGSSKKYADHRLSEYKVVGNIVSAAIKETPPPIAGS
ncbi:hypothetical protein A2715_02810 [Candidatus Woesebacteria bacterium RIFCSPHIGHO2_01_FULL_39_32]|uniref:Uncharacterized protein n=1 Tax=Candidatus Woesebacteria bacterium RIFCSPLOWO2_01_FULL_39_25 TaxID=1802521 RepID=A0A1F8BMC6_9BACT|nr:MAG: hypothetical protein A2124_02445 [Candidatus Woesebacteria bacterium GWB1_37_5]OGM24085.1 MAG: hypothetical protein A2715_02810 [Candidatus Woesebacteria bacterium RIFCSPHIGHO2_01_FULL_39_32]OGM37936.1 MAG: hypothetical protein A3F01_02950 [Candidatus Woesebacteria bacterium RIFCSPHIGHO2_12_FULL_38_11]OGM64428.1 MAG: hypothetical protein A2893_00985 [Candidatus Woesebacteria bacterium RIFCSPLOWO2_01_FULL_39_25]